jgi:predicted DsbA family dithiol-disulfide isomerase
MDELDLGNGGSAADGAIAADVRIREFTDPGCPWAWSAEPFRRRLDWLYKGSVTWEVRMVGLSESPQDYLDKGFTPEKQSDSFKRIAREHGMPIDSSVRPRMYATLPACRAIVAVRLHAPDRMRHLIRRLRVLHFSGSLLDEPETIQRAAIESEIEPDQLAEWTGDPEVESELRADMAAAREPMPAARVLDDRLANWSGGRRYTCPSYEITRLADGVTISVPGFQPFAAYDVVLANLVPGLERCEPPEDVRAVLEWAAVPLASQEVATLLDTELDDAREQLGRVADEEHVGADGFWTLR